MAAGLVVDVQYFPFITGDAERPAFPLVGTRGVEDRTCFPTVEEID